LKKRLSEPKKWRQVSKPWQKTIPKFIVLW
jgi:hypothetical protein